MLFARGRLKHQYPHSWRSKKPVIFRNTPQWFVHMDKELGGYGMSGHPTPPRSGEGGGDTFRNRALAAIDATRFVPAGGQTRLRAMIAERPDWVLSRQRAWGVPICVFADEDGNVLKDDAVNARILEAFEAEGADAWFADDAASASSATTAPMSHGRRSRTSSTSGSIPVRPTHSRWRTGRT